MNEPLSARIDAALERRGSDRALVAGDAVVTGYELRRRVYALSSTIRALGVKPGDTVGVLVDRSAESVIALLASLNMGCAYLPLDPTAPEPWLLRLVVLTQARLILYPGEESAPAAHIATYTPYGAVSVTERWRGSTPGDPVRSGTYRASRLAYVMGTSGTTGPPEAVPVSEAGLLHYCDAFVARVGGPTSLAGMRMASVTTLAADLGNTMIFPALLCGGELHLISDEVARDPSRFAEYVRDHEIDALKVVPTHLRALLNAGPAALPNRLLVVGGEPFGLDLVERLETCAPRCAVFNHYGPTETTVGVAMRLVETSAGSASRLRTAGHRSVPVGTALGASEFRVVDEQLGPCAPGQIGELVIGGPGVARGYLGPSRRADRFITTRWSCGEPVFRSGDRARLSPHGEIELFGRADRQLKVRGHRVEATGVEEELRACQGVRDVYVDIREQGELGETLIAWVHTDVTAGPLGERALREFLLARLPAPQVPSRIVLLRELPRTTNGKVDQRALPGLSGERLPAPHASGADEDAVSRIFAEVLALPHDAARDDFFRLGGHSLAALRVIGRLRDECGLDLPFEDFFADPRPAGVVRAARPVQSSGTDMPDHSALLESPQARALWAHLQLNPRDTAYVIPLRLKVTGPVDIKRIRAALIEFASRHEALRTRFVARNGSPAPVVSPTPAATLRFDEPGGLDIETGPVVRVVVTEVGPAEHLVEITIHHIVFDGLSLSVLVRELACLLSDEALPPPAVVPMTHVLTSQRPAPLGDGAGARLGLSSGQPFGGVRAKCHAYRMLAGLWPLVESRASELRTTPFALVAAAWALVLSRQDDEPVVTIGTPADLREGSAQAEAVGYLVNVVVLEVEVRRHDTVQELVARTHQAVGRALADRGWPYAERVASQRAATGTPPTRTLLTIERLEHVVGANVEIRQEVVHEPRPMLGVDVCVLVDDDGGASVQLHHRDDVCPEWRARCLADQLDHVLSQLVADADTPVSHLSVLPEAWGERVAEWSCGPVVPPLERWGAKGFLARAVAEPGAVALAWPGGEWTHSRLVGEIERTAQMLRDRGLGPGHVVAVSAPPSPAAVVAWHAAHLVDVAVLALDPAWPEHRRALARNRAQAIVQLSSPDGLWLDIEGQASAAAPHVRDLAYLVLTSGSTGEPKMVAVQRDALANEQAWFAAEFPLTDDDRVLAHTSPGFDVAIWELLGPLALGARLVFPAVGRRNDVPHLASVIREHAVTVVQTVPSLLEALLSERELGPSRLRLVVCGGEELPPSLVPAVAERLPHTVLVNVYGPSETAIDATFHRVERLATPSERVPLGRPIAGVRAYVLNDRLRPQPPGAFGQLAIGGAAVGGGYLNDPAETARRFVPDPFSSEPGARLYLTGDRARWDGEGRLEFGGRRDNQVKMRGNRVELGEIEAVLRAMPMVADAVVHPLGAGTREARLAALVVPANGGALSVSDLHGELARKLPPHLVPSEFGIVESLPRLANGKLARDAIPLDALQTPATDTELRTAMEELVGGVWAELLGHGTLKRDLPFFASGGTSLLIPTLQVRLSREVGVTLSVPELFEHVTIQAQASALEWRAAGGEVRSSTSSGRGALRRQALATRRRRTSE